MSLSLSRRGFLGAICGGFAARADDERVLDIHQHTNYSGRTDEELIAHQRRMGVTQTVLLPAGSRHGLAVGAGGNETVLALARALPGEFLFFANEVPDLPDAGKTIEEYLKLGAIGIGEQKFAVDADSKHMRRIAKIAKEYKVPVLMHFQFETYNLKYERFHRMLEKYSKVNFIGHAQTWWANIDRKHLEPILYPKGPVTPGGITDKLLSDYPNIFGDLSAGSGLNALLRDEDHAREFLHRHQDRLLYGSDCNDREGAGKGCSGAQQLAAIRRLSPSAEVTRKILYENAARLFRLPGVSQ